MVKRIFVNLVVNGIQAMEKTVESALKSGEPLEIKSKNKEVMQHPKILFLTANPKREFKLRLDEEVRDIEHNIMLAQKKDQLILVNKGAVRVNDLQLYLNQERPNIVHFSGHGTDLGEIALEDEIGKVKIVSPAALAMIFKALKDNIQCVVLNTCFSSEQANAIAEYIDCVIGMSSSISDEAAIKFSTGFYLAIASGRSIKNAFDQGLARIMLENIPEEHTPKLLVRNNTDPSKIFVVKPSRSYKNLSQNVYPRKRLK